MSKKEIIHDSVEVKQRTISDFLNTEVKSYAQYVLKNRTMPSIMDGLRVGARKIIWASFIGDLKNKKFVKLPNLMGTAMQLQYQHGDASLAGTIVNLCCKHNNKYAPLEAIGQIPSLRVPKCDTAVRYLMVRKSPYLDMFNVDKELLNIQIEEGEQIEPTFFLPIIPWMLLNRTSAPGFGFSYKCVSYSLDDIIDNTIQSIVHGTCTSTEDVLPLRPEIEGINPENIIYNSNKNRWYTVGTYVENFEKDMLTITDLPFDVSFEGYEELLNNYKEKGIITRWDNFSEQDEIRYIITFPKGRLKYLVDTNKWKFYQGFKLFSIIKPDILNCIDADGKTILFFENPQELIDAFVKRRLVYYDKRKTRTIDILKNKIDEVSNKIKFINLVISKELQVFERKKTDIIKDLEKHNLPNYVLDMKMWTLTEEEILKLKQKLDELNNQLDYITKTTIKEMYLFDLIEMKEKYSEIKIIS